MNKYSHIPEFVFDNLDSIEKLRKANKLTIEECAEAIGISQWLFIRIEAADTLPSKKVYNKLALFFEWEIWE